MNQQETSRKLSNEQLAHYTVINHPDIPVSDFKRERWQSDIPRFRVIGIGSLGARMVQMLPRSYVISCHEVIYNSTSNDPQGMMALIPLACQCDILFIMTGLDDEPSLAAALAISDAAREAGVLTYAIVPDVKNIFRQTIELTKAAGFAVSVSERSFSDKQNLSKDEVDLLTGYSMRHVVTVGCDMVSCRRCIFINSENESLITQRGVSSWRLGIGTASGQDRGRRAAGIAMERLEKQGVPLCNAIGIMVIVQYSQKSGTDDYEDACRAVLEVVSPERIMVQCLANDELLWFTDEIRVTVFAACKVSQADRLD